jgi:hypothetical protein
MGGSQIHRGYLGNDLITKLSTSYPQPGGRTALKKTPSGFFSKIWWGREERINTLPHRGVVGIRKNESKTLSPPAEVGSQKVERE